MLSAVRAAAAVAAVIGALTAAPFAPAATPTTPRRSAMPSRPRASWSTETRSRPSPTLNGGTRASGRPATTRRSPTSRPSSTRPATTAPGSRTSSSPSSRRTRPRSSRASRRRRETYTLDDDFLTMEYSGSGDVTGALVPTNDIVIPPGAEASTSNSGCEAADFTPAVGHRAAGRADPARHLRLRRQGAERRRPPATTR